MAKQRFLALDGLRGFAAFSVVLFHIVFNLPMLASAPLVIALTYNAISVGPNAVQILFVLSGFLMAYLYPDQKSIKHFIQKRYARISQFLSLLPRLLGSSDLDFQSIVGICSCHYW